MTGEIERIAAGDHTQAEALRIARDRLEKMGWKYTAADIGKRLRKSSTASAPTYRSSPDDRCFTRCEAAVRYRR